MRGGGGAIGDRSVCCLQTLCLHRECLFFSADVGMSCGVEEWSELETVLVGKDFSEQKQCGWGKRKGRVIFAVYNGKKKFI